MAQIVNELSNWDRLGTGLGKGVASALQDIMDHKVNQVKERAFKHALDTYVKAPAGSPERYEALFKLPEKEREIAFKQEIESRSNNALQDILYGDMQQRPQTPDQQLQSIFNELLQEGRGEQAAQQDMVAQANPMQQQAQPVQEPYPTQLPRSQILQKRLEENKHRLSPTHLKQLNEEINKQRTSEEKDYQSILKENKTYVEDVQKKGRAAKLTDQYLDRMNKLIDKGDLPYSFVHNIRQSLGKNLGKIAGTAIGYAAGGPLGAVIGSKSAPKDFELDLTNFTFPETAKDAQEFTKLSYEFLNKMKDLFGAKVSNDEMKAFLESIPKLSMTDGGKRAVIRNMKIINEGWKLQNKAIQDIVKAHGGRQPRNIEALVQEKIGAQLDELSRKFVEGIEF